MASTSSSSMARQEHHLQKYDVFMSFRGLDTRYGIVSHISEALNRKKILTFVDERLEKGEMILEALSKTIEDSKVSIIIISENFASSTYCLKEVAKIIWCRKRMEQMVVPVFYHVDPSHVRKQSGTFAEAFVGHEEKHNKEEVEEWRSALTAAANIVGYHATEITLESELVEKIVGAVLEKLNKNSSSDTEGLVGMDWHIKQIESLLHIEMVGVSTRAIGIWGMGGIGKTTIAEVIFNRIRSQFEGYCFLANIREECEKHSLDHIRKELVSTILNDENLDKGRYNKFVMDRLCRLKVLIVLDDVDYIAHLEYLVGGVSDLFGLGSRVIITTRNKQVLQGRVDEIYEVKPLSDCDALQLFRQYGFKRNHPTEDFEELLRRIVQYAQGNPSVLKFLGANLLSKSKEIWESVLNCLKKIPLDEIQEILRISYDGSANDSIQIEYDENGRSVWSVKHGGPRGSITSEVELDFLYEYLTSVSGYCTKYNIHSSFPSSNVKIVGFHGRSGLLLDSIGVHVQPITKPNPCESVGPFGGQNGNMWDDGVYTTVRQLIITAGLVIDSISIDYDKNGQSVRSPTHGKSNGGKKHTVKLDYPGEFLISVSGYYGSDFFFSTIQSLTVIQSLTIQSNKRTYGPFGTERGNYFSLPSSEGKIIKFHGRSGAFLDAMERISNSYPLKSLGPFGGQGGEPWDDGVYSTLRQITVAVGCYIDSIRFEYDKNGSSFWSPKHGESNGGNLNKIELDYPGEFLISISGYYSEGGSSSIVQSLTFQTNKRTYGPFGIQKGSQFSVPSKSGKIVGFHGRNGFYLDSIGAHVEPLSHP